MPSSPHGDVVTIYAQQGPARLLATKPIRLQNDRGYPLGLSHRSAPVRANIASFPEAHSRSPHLPMVRVAYKSVGTLLVRERGTPAPKG